MTSLGVIVARRSSKRLPGKNLLSIGELPIVGWMARAAAASQIDRLIVSTEDDEIAATCEANGAAAPFRRPEALTADYASSPDIAGHAIDAMNKIDRTIYETCVLLQPTTPFVLPEHIDACLAALEKLHVACAFTAKQAEEPPQWMFRYNGGQFAEPLLKKAIEGDQEHSQHLAKAYLPSGAAYAFRVDAMRAQNRIICDPATMVVMDKARAVDIDDPFDLTYAKLMARENKFEPVPLAKR
jgi:CMP-N-acetylneuraminic acid synthetase